MDTALQQKVFHSLQVSREQILDEVATLMACQKRSEFMAEIDWYEKKYQMDFSSFDHQLRQNTAT